MKAILLRDESKSDGTTMPAGTVLDDPQCFWLVRMGIAAPADAECRDRAGMNRERLAAAIRGAERTRRGIRPEHYDAFDAGEMQGYRPNGKPIPGPAPIPEIPTEAVL